MRTRSARRPRYRWIETPHYPSCSRTPQLRHSALVGIGGNLGDTLRRFEHLWWLWRRSPLIRIHATAPILYNPPFGYADQPDFANTLAHISTRLTPRALLRFLLATERRFGRKRTRPNGPRTLDLDLLRYDTRRIHAPTLTLPHPGWGVRPSVMWPAAYLGRSAP